MVRGSEEEICVVGCVMIGAQDRYVW